MKSIQSFSSDWSSENRFKENLIKYVERTYDKLSYTKSIVDRATPVQFKTNYIPLTVSHNNRIFRIKNIDEYLLEFPRSLIIGIAGSGKTTLLKYITLSLLEEGERKLPVFIELRNFSSHPNSFEDFVCNHFDTEPKELLKKTFEKGSYVFIFDGYDEINYTEGIGTINEIENFISKYSLNNFLISSRPGTNIDSLSNFKVVKIEPVNIQDLKSYINKLSLDSERKEQLFITLNENSFYKQYLNTPLLMTLYIEYFKVTGVKEYGTKKYLFFRNIIDHLFSKHDSVSKLGYVRERLSGLSKDNLEKISQFLAFRMVVRNINSFSKDSLIKELETYKRNFRIEFENEKLLYDLTITVNILQFEYLHYSFPHISIKEYLCAIFISNFDESRKIKFYKNHLFNNENFESYSLLNFLFELDQYYFIRNYLLPQLEINHQNDMLFKLIEENNYLLGLENNFSRFGIIDRLKEMSNYNTPDEEDEIFKLI